MPNDIKAILFEKIYNIVNSGAVNYNAAISGGVLASTCQTISVPIPDYRTLAGRMQIKVSGDPASYPQIRLLHTGGSEDKSPTTTFGLIQGRGCDTIVPIIRTMDLTITYDKGVQSDNGSTPLEEYIEAAFHNNGYPTFGLQTYGLRFFRFQDRRRNEGSNIVFRRSMTFDLWPHIAALQ